MLHSIFKKSWTQHHTKQLLYGHLSPISRTIQERWTRHVGRCWWNKNEIINDVLQRTPTHGHTSIGRLAKTFTDQICANTRCRLEYLSSMMADKDGQRACKRARERARERERERERERGRERDQPSRDVLVIVKMRKYFSFEMWISLK